MPGYVMLRSPEARRVVRAVEVLERIGTAEARAVLQGLVKEHPDTWVAWQAAPAPERLGRR